jgi:hypothetical protein
VAALEVRAHPLPQKTAAAITGELRLSATIPTLTLLLLLVPRFIDLLLLIQSDLRRFKLNAQDLVSKQLIVRRHLISGLFLFVLSHLVAPLRFSAEFGYTQRVRKLPRWVPT